MNPDRWRQIDQLLEAALDQPPEQRAAFLAGACGDDESLRRKVEALLRSGEAAENFIETPVASLAGKALAQAQAEAMTGRELGHYKILSQLGAGGMGEVYLAEDRRLRRKVALKLLPARFTSDAERLRRFEMEGRAVSALNHPNILTIHEIGKTAPAEGGACYIVTEFIEGQTLRQQLAGGRLTLRAAVEVALQTASALVAAHAAGIVHRDIKPENIMVRPDALVKVLDFGLAKLTEGLPGAGDSTNAASLSIPGRVLGTLRYMSPEQARGLKLDARTDIFSLGVVLYELLTGESPFAGATTADVIAAVLDHEPPPLSSADAPPALARIVSKALRKDREQRYQTSQELLNDLHELQHELEFSTGERAAAKPNVTLSSGQILLGEVKRHKFVAVAALILLAIAATAAFFYFNRKTVLTDKDTILLADFQNTTGEAVFDGTLNQGLAVQLGQSPFLSILPKARVQETLRLMGRGIDEKITADIAREICQRQGIRAFITGSIAALGKNYVLTLEAVNANTGAPIISEQNEVESKEQVLRALGKTVTSLREKLGESFPSISKFDAPIEQATTSSLEALKSYSLATEQYGKGVIDETVVSLYRRGIELDPNFALCYGNLARLQFNIGRYEEAVASATKAFELRERTSENEKLSVAVFYYKVVALDLNKAIETGELWKRTYPRFWQPYHSLADLYYEAAQYEKAVENGREAVRLNPNFAPAYTNPAGALVLLNRFAEAKELYRQAMANHLEHIAYHFYLFWIAYFERDDDRLNGDAATD